MMPKWQEIKEAPARLGTRTRDRLNRARSAGRQQWVQLRARAVEGADGWVGRVERWPAIGRIAGVAGRLVDRQRERWGVVPVEGWDELNARDAIKAIAKLEAPGLKAARRQEVGTKNRATVLKAIDDHLRRSEPAERADSSVAA